MVRADERLKNAFPRITLPVLILHGTADKATKPSGSQFFYDSAGSVGEPFEHCWPLYRPACSATLGCREAQTSDPSHRRGCG